MNFYELAPGTCSHHCIDPAMADHILGALPNLTSRLCGARGECPCWSGGRVPYIFLCKECEGRLEGDHLRTRMVFLRATFCEIDDQKTCMTCMTVPGDDKDYGTYEGPVFCLCRKKKNGASKEGYVLWL